MPVPAIAASVLVIVGAGGHGRVVADAALASGDWQTVVATDADASRCEGELLPGVQLLTMDQALALPGALLHFAIGNANARDRQASQATLPLASVVHPRASLSMHALLEPGCFIAALAVVAPGARIGLCGIVNHGAVVDHDVHVGAWSHIAPGASLGGGAQVGERVLVGAGARVLPGVRVADGVVIGAGAVVHGDVEAAGVYAGVPARKLK